MPGNRHTRLVETGRDSVEEVRPIHVMLDILLSRPDDLHRSFHMHRDLDSAGDAVNLQPAAPLTLIVKAIGNLLLSGDERDAKSASLFISRG
jgi:hypothetical protein